MNLDWIGWILFLMYFGLVSMPWWVIVIQIVWGDHTDRSSAMTLRVIPRQSIRATSSSSETYHPTKTMMATTLIWTVTPTGSRSLTVANVWVSSTCSEAP